MTTTVHVQKLKKLKTKDTCCTINMQNKLGKGYSDRDIIGWQRNGDVRGEEDMLKTYFL